MITVTAERTLMSIPIRSSTSRSSTPRRPSVPRAVAIVASGLCLVAFGAGCSGDDVADKVTEKVAESGGEDVDVDIDSDSGDMTIESADGSKMQMGTAELPENWPSEIPLPDDYELNQALSTNQSNSPSFTIGGTLAQDSTEVFDEITAAFVAGGWTETTKATNSFDGGTNSNASYENGSWEVLFNTQTIDGEAGFGYTAVQVTE